MTFRKKLLLAFVLVLVGAVVVGYFVGNMVLTKATNQWLAVAAQRGGKLGLQLKHPRIRSARLTGWNSAVLDDFKTKLRMTKSATYARNREFTVTIDQLRVRLVDDTVDVTGDGIRVKSDLQLKDSARSQTEIVKAERIEGEGIATQFQFDLADPGDSLEKVIREIVRLANTGHTELPVTFDGTLGFALHGQPVHVNMGMKEYQGEYSLELDPRHLESLANLFDEPITLAERQLVAANPLRAPRLLRIKQEAESTAARARDENPLVPEDAYRHILWSFLLTRAYGPEFAQEVTDAHEEGNTGNTERQRDMDYHNNRIGRQYAKAKVTRGEILDRLMKDPRVLREPDYSDKVPELSPNAGT